MTIKTAQAASLKVVDEWTTRLTGLPEETLDESRNYFRGIARQNITKELVERPDIDSAAGMALIYSAMRKLIDGGVPESKLVAKLRKDPAVWPAALEILAGAHIVTHLGDKATISMDHGPGGGRNCDFRLSIPGLSSEKSIEFKAVGLSKSEISFFERAATVLPAMCPHIGIATAHSPIDAAITPERSVLPRQQRRELEREARRRSSAFPVELKDVAAAAVVAHFTEQGYLERARERIQHAIRQLAPGDECWASLWWNNGASSDRIQELLETIDLPRHIVGLIVTGSAVVFPSREIHHYTLIIPRHELRGEDAGVVSLEDHPLAKTLFDIVEDSAGPRPTLIVDPSKKGPVRSSVLFRDGRRSQFPFNLILARDPEGAREFVAG